MRKVDWDTQPLGKISDSEISRVLGCARAVVQRRRAQRNIGVAPPSGRLPRIRKLDGARCASCGQTSRDVRVGMPRKHTRGWLVPRSQWVRELVGGRDSKIFKTQEEANKWALKNGAYCSDCMNHVCDCGSPKRNHGLAFEQSCDKCSSPVTGVTAQVLEEIRHYPGVSWYELSDIMDLPVENLYMYAKKLGPLIRRTEMEDDSGRTRTALTPG
jgi:hypothetical protein